MSGIINGTEFKYRIDTEYGVNHDGFIAEGTESIVFKGIKFGGDLRYSCALKFKPKVRLSDFMEREYKIIESMQTCRSVVRVLDVIEDLGDFSVNYQNGEISAQNFFCVIEEFFHENPDILLYLCSTQGGQQAQRARLFSYWFNKAGQQERYYFKTVEVKGEIPGTKEYVAIIIPRNYPQALEVLAKFEEETSMFNAMKP